MYHLKCIFLFKYKLVDITFIVWYLKFAQSLTEQGIYTLLVISRLIQIMITDMVASVLAY